MPANDIDQTIPIHPIPNQRRRQLFVGTAVAAAAGLGGISRSALAQAVISSVPPQAKSLPPFVSWKDSSALIVHTANTMETRRSAFGGSVITPLEQLYVRNNLPVPDAAIVADREAWQVAVEGVKRPRTLTLKELKGLGLGHKEVTVSKDLFQKHGRKTGNTIVVTLE